MDAYQTFIPISVSSDARVQIINDFFDLIASLAAHGKSNGLGGYKLSRYAGWWAFEHYDTGKGFEAGYKAWNQAADAACHLFFAYLRSSSPDPGKTNGVLDLPRSLQQLVATTTYPPPSSLLSNNTTKVVMVVDVVSPTPYALLRRAKNFEYRDDDHALQQFAGYEDPVEALTDECKRVLRAISTTNQSQVSDAKTSTSLVDPSWSRFEDIGFTSALDDPGEDENGGQFSFSTIPSQRVNSSGRSPIMDLNRPTTPSWADFLSSGFTDENGNKAPSPLLLPPDKMLPPIHSEPRGQSSQSHRRNLDIGSNLEPGELASITKISIDDSFWWVWISSLAGEEPTSRKACFGRCALIETSILGGQWMVMEEQVKGAAPEPVQGAYIAEKKGFLGFTTKRGRLTRRRSGIKKSPLAPGLDKSNYDPSASAALAPDQQAKIHKAAMDLANKKRAEEASKDGQARRGRFDDAESRTTSIFTLGFKDEASPALQWAKQYDKNTIRAQYLGNELAGKGSSDFLTLPQSGLSTKGSSSNLSASSKEKDLPSVPKEEGETKSALESIPAAASHDPSSIAPVGSLPVAASASHSEHVPIATIAPVTVVESVPLPVQPKAPMTTEPATEAAAVALPPPTPEPESVEALPEVKADLVPAKPIPAIRSTTHKPSSPEQHRGKPMQEDLQSAQRPNGIKRLFGTMRKSKDEKVAPPPAPEANPAVAAARRALDAKMNQRAESNAASSTNYAKYKGVRTPIAAAAPITDTPSPAQKPSETAAVAVEAEPKQLSATASSQPASMPIAGVTPSGAESDTSDEVDSADHQPPRTRRDEEFDQLSRVDTKEREHADEEFSRFDQGPLLDQPSALPQDFPDKGGLEEEDAHQNKHQSVYSAVTMQTDDTDDTDDEEDEEPSDPGQEVTANDRWAQIRRNAAERAQRFPEEHGTRSRTETRTDDGETSGEESKLNPESQVC